jgi:hypothetical protein
MEINSNIKIKNASVYATIWRIFMHRHNWNGMAMVELKYLKSTSVWRFS